MYRRPAQAVHDKGKPRTKLFEPCYSVWFTAECTHESTFSTASLGTRILCMQTPKLSLIYHSVLAVGVLALLWIRREPILSGSSTPFDLLVFATAAALLLAPLFREVSLGGVKLTREFEKTRAEIGGKISELRAVIANTVAVSPTFNVQLQEMVHREVSRAQQEALRLMAAIDRELVPLWESEHSSVPSDYNAQKLDLISNRIKDLEARLLHAPQDEKVHYGWVLRSLYWMWLEAARKHYTSSGPYQEIRQHVENSFSNLTKLG